MRQIRRLRLLATIVLFGASLGLAKPAQALSVTLSELNSGASVTVNDNGLGDLAWGTMGSIIYTGILGGVAFDLTTALAAPVIGSADTAMLSLTQLSVTASSSAKLLVQVTDTNRTIGPAGTTASFSADMGGALTSVTSGSSVNGAAYVDLSNAAYGTSGPSNALGTFTAGSFSSSGVTSFAYSGPFSMTQVALLDLSAGSVASFDMHSKVTSVPEPASIGLAAMGIVALAGFRRRRATVR